MRILYKGGVYNGGVRSVYIRNKRGRRHRRRFVPHGWGKFSINGMTYTGFWRNGYEEGDGKLKWPSGETLTGTFKEGRPEPTVLQSVHEAKHTKQQNRRLKIASNSLMQRNELLQQQLAECQDDLAEERQNSMNIALALDRLQDRFMRLYNAALAGDDAGALMAIRNEV